MNDEGSTAPVEILEEDTTPLADPPAAAGGGSGSDMERVHPEARNRGAAQKFTARRGDTRGDTALACGV